MTVEADTEVHMSGIVLAHADRRSDRTRADLMSAFTKLVFATGFENVSVQAIAATANVSRSTFYEHFSGKDDVLRACLTRFFAIVADCATTDEHPIELTKVLGHLWSNRRLTDAIFSGHARLVLVRNQADLVEQRLRAEGRSLRLPARLAAIHIADGQIALIEAWLRGRAPCTVDLVAEALFRSSRASVLALIDE